MKEGFAPIEWVWERPDENTSGAAGNLAKLFRNEAVKEPGFLSEGAPSSQATVLAREVIQNSWDAAQVLRRELESEHVSTVARSRAKGGRYFTPPPFEIRFDFRVARDAVRDDLIRNLRLDQLAHRLDQGLSRQDAGLGETDCLQDLFDTEAALPYMIIEEEATSGMYGRWRRDESKMFQALVAVGFTTGDEERGGSYGFGKAGLIRGSAIRTVIAYTCFRKREDEPVTRRLLGVTYWNHHRFACGSYTGFARLGNQVRPGVVVPFIDKNADAIATRLGLRLRSSDDHSQLGTTFVLIEPTLTPEDLVIAIERSWWPALEEPGLQFGAVVRTPSGESIHPRPSVDPDLRSFITAYEVATLPGSATHDSRKKSLREQSGALGVLGLVSDADHWSYPEQTADSGQSNLQHRSLVALIRDPRMVVEYSVVGRAQPPYIRGAFVADHRVNNQLRDTEPKGHDAWDWKAGDALEGSRKVAKKIHDRVRDAVLTFKKDLKPPVRPPEDIDLPVFDRLFRRLLSGSKGTRMGPEVKPRPVSIRTFPHLQPVGRDKVRVLGRAEFRLSEHHSRSNARCRIAVRFRFVENDAAGEWAAMRVRPAPGFEEVDGSFVGTLTREKTVFRFKTTPYREDWSGRLIAEADIIEDERPPR